MNGRSLASPFFSPGQQPAEFGIAEVAPLARLEVTELHVADPHPDQLPDPLAEVAADDGLQAGERDVIKDAAREKAAEARPDPLLRESAFILADATALLSGDQKLAGIVLPETGRALHWAE